MARIYIKINNYFLLLKLFSVRIILMTTIKQDILELKAGDTLASEDQPCKALYTVKEGPFKAFKVKNGKTIPVGLINSGEYVGEMSLLTNSNFTTSVVALTDAKVICLQKEAIEKQLEQAPSWLIALTRGLVHRLNATNELLKRNGIEDEAISSAIKAIEAKNPIEKD